MKLWSGTLSPFSAKVRIALERLIMKVPRILTTLVAVSVVAGFCTTCSAQNPFRPSFNQTVQLPVLRFFNVRTVVSAPDGGVMSLGGVKSHSSGSRSSGIPGLAGRPFQNRGTGFSSTGSHLVVKPRIIISSELEADVLREAERRNAIREKSDPNGPKAVQAKADFITRNIGRSKK